MNDFVLIDKSTGNKKHFDTRAQAEEKRDEMSGLVDGEMAIEPVSDASEASEEPDGADNTKVEQTTTDGGQAATVVSEDKTETVAKPEQRAENPERVTDDAYNNQDPLEQLGEELDTDPLSILPSHMIDEIQGKPSVNKRGYAMIAERYNISTSAEIVQFPWDNEEGRCVAKATAVTENGKEYSGWATACADDGDMDDQLIELAETRSLKRSISWASGVGIVSYQELMDELE